MNILLSLVAAIVTAFTPHTAPTDNAACRSVVVSVYESQNYSGDAAEQRYIGAEDDARVDAIFDAIETGQPVAPVATQICG